MYRFIPTLSDTLELQINLKGEINKLKEFPNS